MSREVGAESGVDQEVAFGVVDQDRGRGEVALVAERTTAEGEGRPGFVAAGGELVDGHFRRRSGCGEGVGPGGRYRKRRHGPIV